MRSAVLIAIGAVAASAIAQTNILPTSANGVVGTSQNSFPWGTNASSWPGLRIMCLYDSTHFTGAPAPITTPILITSVRWRANEGAVVTSWTGGNYTQATLSLGTAPIDHTAASVAWNTNIGPDYTQVYSGPVTVIPGSGAGPGVPGPYVVDITLNTPFVYDPNAGDLVVDTDFLTGAWIGGSLVAMDVHATNLNARRVFSSSMYPNANGVDQSVPVIEVGYTPLTGTVAATSTPLGAGCVRSFTSVYELFAASATFDLANSALTFVPDGLGGYIVAPGGGFVPVGSVATPVTLALANNSSVTQTFTVGSFPGWTAMTICSNGHVAQATGNTTSVTPSTAAMLGAAQTAFWSWHDYDPSIAGGGQVVYEESAGAIVVTWNGVWDAGGASAANANDVQFQFSPTGVVTIAWGAMSGLGNGHLVGYSPGGASLNPGATDLSAIPGSIAIGAADTQPLTLTSVSRPIIGTAWNLEIINVPPTGVFGLVVFGFADPGINDLSFVGMPGCGLRASLDVLASFPVSLSTQTYILLVPNAPSLLNAHVFTTSAVFQVPPVNAFGAITSNGVDGKIGDM